jgi:hypothetical protein
MRQINHSRFAAIRLQRDDQVDSPWRPRPGLGRPERPNQTPPAPSRHTSRCATDPQV